MTGEFRCVFHARDYDSTVAFYWDALDLPIVEEWDVRQVSLLGRPGIGPHGLLQCQPGFRRVDSAGDLSIGKQAGLGVDYRAAGMTSTVSSLILL